MKAKKPVLMHLKRFLIGIGLTILIPALLFVGYMTVGRGRTPSLGVSGSVASLEQVNLGNVNQWILMRGVDAHKPVLLWLHGGPGWPEMALRSYQAELEKSFVVVNWDQRGAGKSYSSTIDPATLTIDQYVSDTHELIEYLRQRFGVEKIYLAGHSWGSLLGVKVAHKYPDLVQAYIGVGQVVDPEESLRVSHEWAFREAAAMNNERALTELRALGPIDTANTATTYPTIIKWVVALGGSERESHATSELLVQLRAPEYTLADWLNRDKGVALTLQSVLMKEVLETHLEQEVPEIQVPVFFLQGRYDYHTPYSLVERYYANLRAPSKMLVAFDQSAHFPNLEEQGKFTDVMVKTVLGNTNP